MALVELQEVDYCPHGTVDSGHLASADTCAAQYAVSGGPPLPTGMTSLHRT